jgi:hypothetical protein
VFQDGNSGGWEALFIVDIDIVVENRNGIVGRDVVGENDRWNLVFVLVLVHALVETGVTSIVVGPFGRQRLVLNVYVFDRRLAGFLDNKNERRNVGVNLVETVAMNTVVCNVLAFDLCLNAGLLDGKKGHRTLIASQENKGGNLSLGHGDRLARPSFGGVLVLVDDVAVIVADLSSVILHFSESPVTTGRKDGFVAWFVVDGQVGETRGVHGGDIIVLVGDCDEQVQFRYVGEKVRGDSIAHLDGLWRARRRFDPVSSSQYCICSIHLSICIVLLAIIM